MTTPTLTQKILAALPLSCPRPAFIKVHRTKARLGAYIHAERSAVIQFEGLPQAWIYTRGLTEEQQVVELARVLSDTIQAHVKSLTERAAKQKKHIAVHAAGMQKRLEFLRELKMVAPESNVMPSFVNVAGLCNLAIESIDVEAGTVSLYTQTDVNLRQLVEFIQRSSNITFSGEQEVR